ncbi:hypothetical protein LCGC14_1811620 [marine sediment metagenome]|uniref:Uncharacterized protein n=1 Tax=marine sediment metagenome TaxID=412755 RepID=A0A0F9JL88_9ZZZZ
MSKWDKVVSVYKWFSNSCPDFVDSVLTTLFSLFMASTIGLIYWVAITLFGWHLLTIIGILLFAAAMVWLAFTHNHYSGGVQEWWRDRPWDNW